MQCAATLTAPAAGVQHTNTATVTATPRHPSGTAGAPVSASNSANAKSLNPALELVKKINGYDANIVPVSVIPGTTMVVRFELTNTGDVALAGVAVTDDVITSGAISCPATVLAIAATMTCTASLAAPAARANHMNTATATGRPVDPTTGSRGSAIVDTDIAQAIGASPGIFVVKRINTDDANSAPGVSVAPGATMNISFEVTNTADVILNDVRVTDDKVPTGSITCPKTVLAVGESMMCSATLTAPAAAVQHRNEATAVGTPIDPVTGAGTPVTARDVAYALALQPGILLIKRINGDDANAAPGVLTAPGAEMAITFDVSNLGPFTLDQVVVHDDHVSAAAISCPSTTLAVGAHMSCTATMPSPASGVQHTNIGTASGRPVDPNGSLGSRVSDSDVAYALGGRPGLAISKQVCFVLGNPCGGWTDVASVGRGSTGQWRIVVSNTGDLELTNLVIADELEPDCRRTSGSLAVGATQIIDCKTTNVVQRIRNAATATATPTGSGGSGSTISSGYDFADLFVDIAIPINVAHAGAPRPIALPITGNDIRKLLVVAMLLMLVGNGLIGRPRRRRA
jgi:hypothetical protein